MPAYRSWLLRTGSRSQVAGSAGDVKDRADLASLEVRDQPAGLFRRDRDKINVSACSLGHHVGHDRQRAVGPGADDQPGSAPRELLVLNGPRLGLPIFGSTPSTNSPTSSTPTET
jgi:hypothetical protein